jgi:hypothetical protein
VSSEQKTEPLDDDALWRKIVAAKLGNVSKPDSGEPYRWGVLRGPVAELLG